MNDKDCYGATKKPVSLNNEGTSYVVVFSGADPSHTDAAAATFTIIPDAHIPPSGQK